METFFIKNVSSVYFVFIVSINKTNSSLSEGYLIKLRCKFFLFRLIIISFSQNLYYGILSGF